MDNLPIPATTPSAQELSELEERCKACIGLMKHPESEVRFPIFVEFAGSPKSGKTTIIGIVSHFFRRMGLDVVQPAEGASLRTPTGLRDDWMAFNTWSGCYALQQVLIDAHSDPPPGLVILDRGLFDVAGWFAFLEENQNRLTKEDRKKVVDFFALDLWSKRMGVVFVFTADDTTSLKRETEGKLTSQPGSVMNKETLEALRTSYSAVSDEVSGVFKHVFGVVTFPTVRGHPDKGV